MRHVTLEPIVTDNEPEEYLADTEDNLVHNVAGQQQQQQQDQLQQMPPASIIQNRHVYPEPQYPLLIRSQTNQHHHPHHHHIPSPSSATSAPSHQHLAFGGTVAGLREERNRNNQLVSSISNALYKSMSTMKSTDSLSCNSDENSSPTTWSNGSDFDADDDDDSNLFLSGSILNKTDSDATKKRRHNIERNKKTHLSANQRAPSASFIQSRQHHDSQPFGMVYKSNLSEIIDVSHGGPSSCSIARESAPPHHRYGDGDEDDDDEIDNENAVRNRNHSLRLSRPARIPRGNGQNLAETICCRILECSNLDEAIKYVDKNRHVINQLTHIITHEAPAYRNYELTRYQIDYSVKESFNPNFWLDREPIVTTADGNCQYHAVSISLTGTEEYTPNVRLATAVAVIDNRVWFDQMLKLIDRGSVHGLVKTISRSYAWGDETTLKAIAVAINRRIFLYSCNFGKKDFEIVRSLTLDELLDAFSTKKYCGGTAIHTYADPISPVTDRDNYIMLFHKSEHFIAVLPTTQHPTTFQPFNPIVPTFL